MWVISGLSDERMNMSAVPPITDSLSATPGCPLCANFSHRILRGTVSRQIKEDRELDFAADTSHWQRRAGECPDGTTRRLAAFEILAPRSQSRVLDIGCGGGQLMRDLALAVAPSGCAVGIDVSDDQLEAARTLCADAPCAEFFNADVCELAWEDGFFDAASSIQTLVYMYTQHVGRGQG